MLHYININLGDASFDNAFLHSDLIDLLNNNSQSNTDKLISNIQKRIRNAKEL